MNFVRRYLSIIHLVVITSLLMLLVSCVHPTWNMVNHTCIMCVSHVKHGASHVYHVCIPRVSCVYLTWIMVHHTCIMCASHVYHVCIPRESWCITRVSCVHPTCIMCLSHVNHGAYAKSALHAKIALARETEGTLSFAAELTAGTRISLLWRAQVPRRVSALGRDNSPYARR